MRIAEFLEHRYGVELAPEDEGLPEKARRVVGKDDIGALTASDLEAMQADVERQVRVNDALVAFHRHTADGMEAGGYETVADTPYTEGELLQRLDAIMEEHGFSVEGDAPVPFSEVEVSLEGGDQ